MLMAHEIEAGRRFSLVRIPGFADGFRHAFVIRGTRGEALFRPGPVPRSDVCAAAGLEGARLHLARQVHGAGVAEFPGDEPAGGGRSPDPHEPDPVEADALITRREGHAVGVATADCLPVLLAAPGHGCAAVHAGWRGLLAGVLEAAVRRLTSVPRGDGAPRSIDAAIGPSIGPCCFEVGLDVADRFTVRFPRASGVVRPARTAEKRMIDLRSAAILALSEAGLDPERIREAGLCSRCGGDLLESYRRDGKSAGRMVGLIGRPLEGGASPAGTDPEA